MSNPAKAVSNPFDILVAGVHKGFGITISNLMPNVLMAYVIVEMLSLPGVMQLIGQICTPLVGLFGLPGEAITMLFTSWLSTSAGVGMVVSLLSKGTPNMTDVTILIPTILLMDSQLQYVGRLLGMAGVPEECWPPLMAVSIIDAATVMLVMYVMA